MRGPILIDTAWIGVIGALGGVAVGSAAELFRARWAFRREKKWSLWDERRRRLEMIYEALEQVRESYSIGVGELISAVATGKVRTTNSTMEKIPWARLRLLANLYAPRLLPNLEVVEKTGHQLGMAMATAVMAQTGDPIRDKPHVDAAMEALQVLNASIDATRDAIVDDSRSLDTRIADALGVPSSTEL
jgi:hypothetical protein